MIKLIGEFLGTLIFLYVSAKYVDAWYAGIALVFTIYTLGHLSGGHYNPAVTFMKYMAGIVSQSTFVKYTLSQLLAAYVVAQYLKK